MTKLRAPVTFEQALTRICLKIGWAAAGELAGKSERTMRDWSDPETGPKAAEFLSIDLALRLDAAYQAAGGQSAPLFHVYGELLETRMAAGAGGVAIARCAAIAARKSGEAINATIAASLPGATPRELVRAERDLSDAIDADMAALATIRANRFPTPGGPEVPHFAAAG